MNHPLFSSACLVLALAAPAAAQGDGATLLSRVDQYSEYNDCWGYTAPDGREYAIIGTNNGTAFYNVVNPAAPYLTGFISGPGSTWRDMKTYGLYCYIVTEGGSGVQIVNLTNPESPSLVTTALTNRWSNCHNIQIDLGTGIGYAAGTNNGVVIFDIGANPTNPIFITNYTTAYVHDLHVQNGQAHNAEIYNGDYRILNVSNLPNTPTKDTIGTPAAFTHTAWANEIDTVAVTTDEVSGARIAFYDISNPNNIVQLSTFTPTPDSIPHNAFIKGDLNFNSWYTEGMVVVDITDPANPIKYASYDTSPFSGASFEGAWGCYPYAPSGLVYISDRSEGLHVIRIDGPAMTISHTPLGDTQNETGPYVADAEITSANGSVSSATLRYAVDGGAQQTVAMSPAGGDHWAGNIPGQNSPAQVAYHIEGQDTLGNTIRTPDSGEYTFIVGLITEIVAYDFEAAGDEGWTHTQIATQDDWQRDTPQGLSTDPNGAYSGNNAWANDVGRTGWNGEYAANVHNQLISPVFDLTGETGVKIRYQRWLGVEERNFDTARIQAQNAGGTWVTVWQNALVGNHVDGAWTEHVIDVSAQADGNAAFRVRYELLSDAGLQLGGWNIDDFALISIGAADVDTISLTGTTNTNTGQMLNYSYTAAPANSPTWLAWSRSNAGQTFQGHDFDLGGAAKIAATGTSNGSGAGAWTVGPVPAGASGLTVYFEVAARNGGQWFDSNLLTLVIN
ncbi:MAG TPA: choice-of-anchor B family protein [Planctomycetota bacterium]